jgi:hypothetical protein
MRTRFRGFGVLARVGVLFCLVGAGGAAGRDAAPSVGWGAGGGDTDGTRRIEKPAPVSGPTDRTRSPRGSGGAAVGASSDAVAAMSDIHDIRPPVPPGPDPWRYAPWVLAGLLAVGGALAFSVVRARRRMRLRAGTVPAMPPEERASAALRALENRSGMDGRDFYFRLTAILRRYLEERYGFPAAEMTTEELCPRFREGGRMPETLAGALETLFADADAVKFAGVSAAEDRMGADLDFARRLVRETTPVAPGEPV